MSTESKRSPASVKSILVALGFTFVFTVLSPAFAPVFAQGAIKRFFFKPLPAGIYYVKQPASSFLKPQDIAYLFPAKNYEITPLLETEKQLYRHLQNGKYKDAELTLTENINHPYSILNLVLLYLYLEEYNNAFQLFRAWQQTVDTPTMIRFVNFLNARNWRYVESRLASEWIEPRIKFYALDRYFQKAMNVIAVRQNFYYWETSLGLRDGKSISAQDTSKESLQLYLKARVDWMLLNNNKDALLKWDAAAKKMLNPSQLLLLQETTGVRRVNFGDVAQMKKQNPSHDFYTRYFFVLWENGKADQLRRFINEVDLQYTYSDGDMEEAITVVEKQQKAPEAVIINIKKPGNTIAP